ncbi:preprotein translocase subunit SecY [Candidatus Azambacteria bacterium RIFCSPHIGHO2_02_FULL_52_12]|uniref:Protein translocase subunit SecY n=1 Tax=Candidatus Azambacteria bacterium RIFCSPLOWO2_01_FULL_46_25 TaxID=1797298 RepID=A0A1F5BUD1_9BACT|nr:MAG: preprotein translocase subunit SecY [Candidatus Azambacteria bacterium RIFCSPHIGHO2_02_FULL_52_12]OGD34223.1 MAG: preprotein translocase subunit SecY [Candidatus Azambacteria bacterium RIFCSPLOWO2_01_FULL_46_25]OGD36761.1 MAG: preprotein translocase subunit SecY [Candidatus Azambacteria bacterium RIFCSPHIGHO2_01_FULL_51_74]
MLRKLLDIFTIKDLRNRIFFVLALLVVSRLAATIPVPGIDVSKLKDFFEGSQFFGLLNIFSGGALSNLSIVMLGVGPYITALIVMQLLTMIFPSIKELYQNSGEQGRQKFNQYTRLLTVPFAALQGYGLLALLQNQNVIPHLEKFALSTNIIVIIAGTVFLTWLGELITEKKIGNGVSLLIFAGIIAALPTQIKQLYLNFDPSMIPMIIVFLVVLVIVIAGVVFISESQRNVPISYAKRIRGSRVYGGTSTYLPLKVNQAGVIPIIFAISILLFPQMLANFMQLSSSQWVQGVARWMNEFLQQGFIYGAMYFFLVVVFTYFYTAVTFDTKQIADNVQKQGGFVPGIRPGSPTVDFLNRVMNRITLAGALSLGLIAVLPYIVQYFTGTATLTIGGTALLIVVSVVLDTMKQIKSQMLMHEYEKF